MAGLACSFQMIFVKLKARSLMVELTVYKVVVAVDTLVADLCISFLLMALTARQPTVIAF